MGTSYNEKLLVSDLKIPLSVGTESFSMQRCRTAESLVRRKVLRLRVISCSPGYNEELLVSDLKIPITLTPHFSCRSL
jgi:hypothetical protein